MKQQLISAGLAVADTLGRHPKRIAAALTTVLLSAGGGAFAVAHMNPAELDAPVRLVAEPVQPATLLEQDAALAEHLLRLNRFETTRAADTPESLLKRLGLADPAAAAFLRNNEIARKALFGQPGRTVSVEASERQSLLKLTTHWVENNSETQFRRLVVEKAGTKGFAVRVETAPLERGQRMVSGSIRNTLYAATDEARVPDTVTKQMTEIFDSAIDFHRGLRKGDRFSIVYEALLADGEPIRAGRVLSVEFVNRGKTHQAIWFQENDASKGAYYSFDGQSLRKAYLLSPMEFSRITSGFGMRNHPIYGYSREHTGVDYGAPIGTPVRTIGDGKVEFAGVQRGYGYVIYIKHRNTKDTTVYAHLSHINVKVGDNVMQGETIGAVGSTGVSTGPHLHFEFRVNNEPQDPTEVLAEQREYIPVSPAGKLAFGRQASSMKLQLAASAQMADASFE